MTDDDAAAGRAPPRFVPTLTEVVAPGDDAAAPSRPAPLAPEALAPTATRGAAPSLEQVVDGVVSSAGGSFSPREKPPEARMRGRRRRR